MSKIGDVISKATGAISGFKDKIIDNIAFESSKELGKIEKWRNSAGQLVQSTKAVHEELQYVGQAHIDSYASYAETDSGSKLIHARSISNVFSEAASRTRILEDVPNGDGKYHFTVKTEPNGPKTVV